VRRANRPTLLSHTDGARRDVVVPSEKIRRVVTRLHRRKSLERLPRIGCVDAGVALVADEPDVTIGSIRAVSRLA
jgi:hypothetical protein